MEVGYGQGEEWNMATDACTRCGGALVSITLRVSTGPRTMHSCSTCDYRVWEAEGATTDLEGVLDELSNTTLPRQNSRAR
jgi:hypothetical protein